ncbi:MAG TPA: NAD(P)-dependent oxidoreductase [Bacteroidales bacterium]|nr:NAD(P)-dependent oxidoreductase [Bacteroidales bacterium]HPJ60367.1 NAD(P)-dependent oxidoreductase [Bacteroidales bacterium]HPR13512.1 NAD(P)-dependent oxidoreductase [Bacteroidales bacterium]HRW85079.1 NAD(P)-dependent oxidoreductase [Bacteroidales bacterium]
MNEKLKIGILRETKNPPDRRVPLTPPQIVAIEEMYPFVEFFVQPGDIRCYSDEEYEYLNIPLREDLSDCDILLGVKEVDRRTFIPGKTYMFFAHVGKKQPYNREMLREMAEKKISLIDYEYLTTDTGERVVAFGRWAGIVGAYNGLRARGLKTNRFRLKPAYQCHDLEEMWAGLKLIALKPGLKILVTGGGRVAMGAMETLGECDDIVEIIPEDFLNRTYDVPVMCRIGPEKYVRRKDGKEFGFDDFINDPGQYESAFLPFTRVTDVLITGHYWDPRSPVFFSKDDMKHPDFRISVIADISCDINGPIPSTVRATTIADPFYGYNPHLEKEEAAFTRPANITVMSIDNLPGELPRDASHDFGKMLISNTVDDLVKGKDSPMLERATILRDGKLTDPFAYLEDYLNFDSVL